MKEIDTTTCRNLNEPRKMLQEKKTG